MGIHVSQPPRTSIFRSNGRVNVRVHLRIHCFEVNSHCFEVNLTLFGTVWHCLALFSMGWALYVWVRGHCTYGSVGTVHMVPWGYTGPVGLYWSRGAILDLDIPVGWALAIPHRYTHPGTPTTPGTPLPPHPVHGMPGTHAETLTSTLSPFCQNCE